jgi:hypothetical protein
MTEFTASNGVKVRIDNPYLDVKYDGSGWHGIGGSNETQALREFFQHERDESNGWWRSPSHPGFVIYPTSEDTVRVFDERDGTTLSYRRNGMSTRDVTARTPRASAAAAYFDEHPSRNPWDEARTGEVWELVYEQLGEPQITRPFTVDSFGHFRDTSGVRMGDLSITAGRRIWPEEDAS